MALKERVALRALIVVGDKPMVYPDFNKIVPAAARGNLDWAIFVDQHGGPHYCSCGMKDEGGPDTADPDGRCVGEQHVIYFVPADFAQAAVAGDPERCSIDTEAAAKKFYDERAHAHEDEETINEAACSRLRVKYGIEGNIAAADTSAMTDDDAKALDPADPKPGIVKNQRRHFEDFKENRNMKIISGKAAIAASVKAIEAARSVD